MNFTPPPPAPPIPGSSSAYKQSNPSAPETRQLGRPKDAYGSHIIKADRSLDIYLKAARGEAASDDVDGGLLKIGELAKAAGESVATIRHWTKAGLLEVAAVTPSGYQMFAADMVERCAAIRRMQRERLTLAEILRRLP